MVGKKCGAKNFSVRAEEGWSLTLLRRLAAVATKQPPPSGDGSYGCIAYQTRVRSTVACGGTFMVILVVSMDSE
jgi:hypothetical protein